MKVLSTKVEPAERAMVAVAAARAGLTSSAWVRRTIVPVAREIVQEELGKVADNPANPADAA